MSASMQGADPSFTDRVLSGPPQPAPTAKKRGRTEESSGGWFDWF